MSDWISVKDKLPEMFVSVICHNSSKDDDNLPLIREGYHIGFKRMFIPALNEIWDIDYWMPFPDLVRNKENTCKFPDGITIKPNGINELDPCIYEDVAIYQNATVIVSKCRRCGKVNISWLRQDDTEEIKLNE